MSACFVRKSLFVLVLCYLYVSCGKTTKQDTILDDNILNSLPSRKIVVWGHSAGCIIEPFIEQRFKELLGEFLEFEGCSVNGETMLQVAARQGSFPVYFFGESCRKMKNSYLIADKSHRLVSSYDDSSISLSIVYGVNPCTINGVEGTISQKQDSVFFTPAGSEQFTLRDTNVVNTAASSCLRCPLLSVFWCDQLSDRNNVDSLIKKYSKMVNYSGNDQYIIIGSVRGDYDSLSEVESALAAEFKEHYFSARAFLISEAEKDLTVFSASDQSRIKEGSVPSAWMKDEMHLNSYGATLVANELYKVVFENGIIPLIIPA